MMLRIKNHCGRFLALVVLLTCSAFLVSCEAVSTDNGAPAEVTEKELAGEIGVGIRPIENQFLSQEPMEVLFYFHNATDQAVTILPWGTPLETNMTADRFTVSIDGELMPYSGPVVKRSAPNAEDFITLNAGEKKEVVVSLSDGYDVSKSGDYEIALKKFVFQNPESEFLTPVMLEQAVVVTRQ